MNVVVDNYEYTQLKSDIENIFEGIKNLLLKDLENPNEYWINFDLEFTKKVSDDEYNFPQANENFNKMINEKNKKIKKHEKKNKIRCKKSAKNGKRKPSEGKKVLKNKNITSTDDSDSLKNFEVSETSLDDSLDLLVSGKYDKSKKSMYVYKTENAISRKKVRSKNNSPKRSRIIKTRKSKKKNYFPIPDDDVDNDKALSKVLKQNLPNKGAGIYGTKNYDYNETTLEADIDVDHIKIKKIESSCNVSNSKIDPNLLSSNNNALNFHRSETLKFLREACFNSKVLLFRPKNLLTKNK
ncbi:Hypothetical protein SRAE_2000212900 [Strongyloides ratti]|uniref:Uncharacterized protein n=1 Tax=Strongyloides ratti TaxID=34506 RepID=A0A090LCE2_STRRB|nr:Hypothetical protein SRAE_2000212900 [Strongyloides ratti]CEF67466.1 Hypothetical protein SRAE_2000212900 [Strongyloides ratti]